MSGRGKGGKGLGKGGAKRHRKVLRDNIQGAHDLSALLRVLTCAHPASLTLAYVGLQDHLFRVLLLKDIIVC